MTAASGIPTEPVGSLPRPTKLQAASADYDAKKITDEQLEAEQEAAASDSIKLQRFNQTHGGDGIADCL